MREWIWTSEVATQLGISQRTVRRYCEAGVLICRRLPSGYWQVSAACLEKITGQLGQVGQPSD